MKCSFRIVAPAVAVLVAFAQSPALAQYANEFVPAKLVRQGTTTNSIAGSGTVVVQVQVNADGSHKAIKVISSTNPGDNAAAMEIAQNSSYRPGASRHGPDYGFLRLHVEIQRQVGRQYAERKLGWRTAGRWRAQPGGGPGRRARPRGSISAGEIEGASRSCCRRRATSRCARCSASRRSMPATSPPRRGFR